MPDPILVRSMFARISARYDFLNRVLSLGIDRRWRAALLRRAGSVRGRVVVDVCCGTGDVSLLLARGGAVVLGVDFTPQMLRLAETKRGADPEVEHSTLFANGDALRLPVRSGTAALCTVAFGIRNVADRAVALREMTRVLERGGTLLVLEFSTPRRGLLRALYRVYFSRVLPRVGGLVSGDREAYRYLPRTVAAWPGPDVFQREMEQAGLLDCGYARLSGGIACLHWGRAGARP